MKFRRLLAASVVLPFLGGAAAFFLVHYYPVIRFLPSDDWNGATRFLAGPVLFAICVFQLWYFIWDPRKTDELVRAEWKRVGRKGTPDTLSDKPGRQLLIGFLGPIFLRGLYLLVIAIWVPMLTVAVSKQHVTHEYVVSDVHDPVRGPRVVDFEGFSFFLGGITWPPDWLFQSAEPGDTVRLSGTGNRWGVFYDEIELIKQE